MDIEWHSQVVGSFKVEFVGLTDKLGFKLPNDQ